MVPWRRSRLHPLVEGDPVLHPGVVELLRGLIEDELKAFLCFARIWTNLPPHFPTPESLVAAGIAPTCLVRGSFAPAPTG